MNPQKTPWYFHLPGILASLALFLPVVYLLYQLLIGNNTLLAELFFRWKTVELVLNTIGLAIGVILLTSVMAFPLAWITSRCRIHFSGTITLLATLPLAIPGYLMAFALLSLTGDNGLLARGLGIQLPRLSGYAGAVLSVSLYTYPFLFLNLRSSLLRLDSSQEEAARSMGYTGKEIFFKVILPQLRPAILTGWLIIALYVLGDFGAVSLMRFETLSLALFSQLGASADRTYLAALALFLMLLALSIVLIEARFLRRSGLFRLGPGVGRRSKRLSLQAWTLPAYGWVFLILFASILVPIFTITFWVFQDSSVMSPALWNALWDSLRAAIPAALLAAVFALPIAYASARYPSWRGRTFERITYFGYALPPIAFALAYAGLSLQVLPFLYQTLFLLIFVYSLHFLAEAVGPIRNASFRIPPRIDEAARSLGLNPFHAFWRTVFPLLRGGLGVGLALVFLSALKELPIAFILSPIGFDSLAMNIWSFTSEGMYSNAAPYALVLVLISAVLVGILFFFRQENR